MKLCSFRELLLLILSANCCLQFQSFAAEFDFCFSFTLLKKEILELNENVLRSGEIRFTSITQAGPKFDAQIKHTYDLFLMKKKEFETRFARNFTHEEDRLLFETIYFRTQNDPLIILDAPRAVEGVPLHLYSRINIDHHGKGIWFDPSHPNRNTTSLVLDYLAWAKKEVFPGDPAQAARFLKNRLKNVSSDNLGDASMAIWSIKNLEHIAADPSLEKKLRFMAFNEDFGIFGSRVRDKEANLRKMALADPEKYGFVAIKYADFLTRQRVILSGYDRILNEAGVHSSDRYPQLPEVEQTKLALKGVEVVEHAIHGKVNDLLPESTNYIAKIRSARDEISKDMVKFHKELQQLAELSAKEFAFLDSQVHIFRTGEIPIKYGVFVSWLAGATGHTKSAMLNIGEGSFIMSIPDGKLFPVSLESVAKAVREANVDKVRSIWRGKVSPQELKEKMDTAAKVVGDRGPRLAFSFGGLSLTRGELLRVIAQLLKPQFP